MDVGKTFSVPDERLSPKVIGWTRRVYERFGTAEADSVVVAQALGHESVGGAFNSKMATMTSYGLVERGQGKIRVTDVGRMIVSPQSSKEVAEGVRAALFKVSLWQRLHSDYTSKGVKIPADFASELARISGVAITEARNKSDWVAAAYAEDLSYLEAKEKESRNPAATADMPSGVLLPTETRPMGASSFGAPSELGSGGRSGEILFVSQDDRIQVSVPRSAEHIRMLRAFIESALHSIEADLANKPESPRKKRKR